ncbi:MAG: hypothetical protein J5516_09235, partial [Bacteroidales bacterium]|nr:hypothetical protein [Bacteroidales bacterium]
SAFFSEIQEPSLERKPASLHIPVYQRNPTGSICPDTRILCNSSHSADNILLHHCFINLS